jgi:hypothetical protein
MDALGNGGILGAFQHGIGILIPVFAGEKALPEAVKAGKTDGGDDRCNRNKKPKQSDVPRSSEYSYYILPEGIQSSFAKPSGIKSQ